jgi:hypothetical protein
MKLPNPNLIRREDVEYKLSNYSLNFEHETGKHKAYVFKSVLGITLENKDILVNAILDAAKICEASERGKKFGMRYNMVFEMRTDIGTAEILTAWIIDDGMDFPRLTTCYII